MTQPTPEIKRVYVSNANILIISVFCKWSNSPLARYREFTYICNSMKKEKLTRENSSVVHARVDNLTLIALARVSTAKGYKGIGTFIREIIKSNKAIRKEITSLTKQEE